MRVLQPLRRPESLRAATQRYQAACDLRIPDLHIQAHLTVQLRLPDGWIVHYGLGDAALARLDRLLFVDGTNDPIAALGTP